MSILNGKNILVMGVRNKWSIAWGITEKAYNEGAKIIISYHGERERESVENLIKEYKGIDSVMCDISNDENIVELSKTLKDKYGKIDGIVHSIAHAKKAEMENPFIETTRDGFRHAMDVSAYSLVAVANSLKDIMPENSSIITLSYMGAEKVFPGYNVMGVAKAALEASVKYLSYDLGSKNIRINAISAGPINTISAKGIKSFSDILKVSRNRSPLRRNVTQEDLGNNAIYLLSNLSSGVTGEVIHVDCGFNVTGL